MILLVLRTGRSRQPWLRYAGVRAPGDGSYPAGIGLPHVLLHVCALLGLMASYEAADTIVGKVDYAPNGEWKNPRVLWVQYQNVKGSGLEQFKKPGTQVIVYPKDFASGQLLLPYSERR
jgi:hypothetical protein